MSDEIGSDCDYEEKLQQERLWYKHPAFRPKHILNCPLFYSPKRNAFNYIFPKTRLSLLMQQTAKAHGLRSPAILLAPIGRGGDLSYVRALGGRVTGIDVSQEAIDSIADDTVEKHLGDIRQMSMFCDNRFDMAVVSLFYHHYVQLGFDQFLKELYRVLKPGGHLFSLEPSCFYPLSWLSWWARKAFGNITGLVEGEMPFSPRRLALAMKRCGFRGVRVLGASFSHNRFPIWLARLVNFVTLPMLSAPLLKYCAWLCLFYGRK